MNGGRARRIVDERQREWAAGLGLEVDARGYLPTVNENLFEPLSGQALSAFGTAAGQELYDSGRRPAKMRALHSSAVLVCNLFDCWIENDRGAIGRAFGTSKRISRVELEAKLPTGLRGTPPTLDLLLTGWWGKAWAVESKFTEPFAGRPEGERFKGAYFEGRLWTGQGLPRCQQLAERLQRGETGFSYLDAFQLLKHALGVKRNHSRGRLILLWFDTGERESRDLAREIDEFAASVDDALGFRGISHQEVFERLAAEKGARRDYVDYMQARYFPKRGP